MCEACGEGGVTATEVAQLIDALLHLPDMAFCCTSPHTVTLNPQPSTLLLGEGTLRGPWFLWFQGQVPTDPSSEEGEQGNPTFHPQVNPAGVRTPSHLFKPLLSTLLESLVCSSLSIAPLPTSIL